MAAAKLFEVFNPILNFFVERVGLSGKEGRQE